MTKEVGLVCGSVVICEVSRLEWVLLLRLEVDTGPELVTIPVDIVSSVERSEVTDPAMEMFRLSCVEAIGSDEVDS